VNSHTGAWTISSASTGLQEAINVGCATSAPFAVGLVGALNVYGTPTLSCSYATLQGYAAVVSVNAVTGQTLTGLNIVGAGGGSTATTTTNLPLSQRSLQATSTIGFSSVSGFAQGNIVQLYYNDGTNVFEQYDPIALISGSNVTFVDPIVVPILTSLSNNLTNVSMLQQVTLRDIRFDCSGSSSSATQMRALFIQYASRSQLDNVSFNNCYQSSGATGLYMNGGYANSLHRIAANVSGGANVDAISINGQTMLQANDLSAEGNPNIATTAFGIGFGYTYLSNISNIASSGNYSREIKLGGSGWNRFVNVSANNSVHANGLAITLASYRNQFSNVTALNNQTNAANGEGLWFDSTDDEYNTFYNVQLFGNATSDYAFDAGNLNNTIYGLSNGTFQSGTSSGAQTDPGSGDRIELAGGIVSTANVGCSGTATSSATIVLTPATNAACTNNGASIQQVAVVAPVNGIARNLRVSAGHGGVNSSSGVVTVTLSGVGATNITCTLGTGTTCSDLLDYYVIPAGTLIQVNVTTQASETLANLLVTFEY
jgi:hypothetical protein